jgi:CAAX prenyl protease-like protein
MVVEPPKTQIVGGISRSGWFRVLPFGLFMVLLGLRGAAAGLEGLPFDPRWFYALTVLLVGGLLYRWRHEYAELARGSWPSLPEFAEAVVVGLLVFVAWIHLDAPWMRLGSPTAAFTGLDATGQVDLRWVAVRWVGAALVVPVMEELFWRSYLMRWLESPDFGNVDPRSVGWRAVSISTGVFMLAHTLWLAAIVAGLAYAWLYRRHGRLGAAVIAHAVTNGALGLWVVAGGHWAFW